MLILSVERDQLGPETHSELDFTMVRQDLLPISPGFASIGVHSREEIQIQVALVLQALRRGQAGLKMR
jgi:hypothetical protein